MSPELFQCLQVRINEQRRWRRSHSNTRGQTGFMCSSRTQKEKAFLSNAGNRSEKGEPPSAKV